ncbi:MAG: phosphatidylcholine/phosphatidylserine synthase [Vicinamibacterales bacterium]
MTAWLVHLYTASGAVVALLAAVATSEGRFRDAFAWLWLAVAIDATDGLAARWFDVRRRLPWFDGGTLDNVVDYLTYVFVPALVVWRVPLVPPALALPVGAAVLLASAYGFSRADAKTDDHFFTGFPSYWNVVVFYQLAAGWSPVANAVLLTVLAGLVFVPVRYVYPSRTPHLRGLTVALGAVWALSMLEMLRELPDVHPVLLWLSLGFPVYYVCLSLWLQGRRRSIA